MPLSHPYPRLEPPDLPSSPRLVSTLPTTNPSDPAAPPDLSEIVAERIAAPAASLARGRVERSVFRGCDLSGGDFSSARLIDVRFSACDLSNTRWLGASLRRIEFIDCRLTGADFSDASLRDTLLAACKADLTTLFGTAAERTAFADCDLRRADFDSAALPGVVFHRCNLAAARFPDATLTGADLRGSSLDGAEIPPGCLRGLTIDVLQAPAIAALLGVHISDTPAP